jgi:hypothetical protein
VFDLCLDASNASLACACACAVDAICSTFRASPPLLQFSLLLEARLGSCLSRRHSTTSRHSNFHPPGPRRSERLQARGISNGNKATVVASRLGTRESNMRAIYAVDAPVIMTLHTEVARGPDLSGPELSIQLGRVSGVFGDCPILPRLKRASPGAAEPCLGQPVNNRVRWRRQVKLYHVGDTGPGAGSMES